MTCASCLIPVNAPLSFVVNQTFYDPEVNQLDDDEAIAFSGKEIDLTPAIAAGLYLSIPMRIVCADDCRGLCHKCGADLNKAACECEASEVNEEFSRMLQGISFADSDE